MTVTAATFRTDFPEFADITVYPNSVIQYWLAISQIMLGITPSTPPQVVAFNGQVSGQTLQVNSIDFGSVSLIPLLIAGNLIPAQALILSQITGPQGGPGTYNLNFSANIPAEEMVGLANSGGAGGNPYWGASSVIATSPPTTMADFATELFVAHQIVLEKQAIEAAASGGDPGTRIGVITSKSVGSVSVSFDVSQIVDEKSGYWGMTLYGLRFIRLARLRGMGPIQIGIGIPPPFLFFNNWGLTGSWNAWAGPGPLFPSPSDTGF